jgi:predicted transposase/invertase (TIGR01784 family)
MVLGIDPKNDYAFKCVFGSQRHARVLIHMLNAVLKPSPGRRVTSVEILNPITEPVVLDDKLSILDVKARDQSGRQFNVEMQMVAPPSLQGRFLYYWAKLYSSQLQSGDQYELLQPVVSICFVDGLLFPASEAYHLPFRLWNPETQLTFSDHLAIHLLQLPNFRKSEQDLADPLDLWLYFLNNGKKLDPENLPGSLRVLEVEEAVRALKMLTHDEIERERYEAREKARRDALSWEKTLERWQQQATQNEQKATHFEQKATRLEQEAASLEQQLLQSRAEGLIAQIRLCERHLKRAVLSDERLGSLSLEELQQVLDELQSQLPS